MVELKFEITKELVSINESYKVWREEVNLVFQNDRKQKSVLRDWDENNKKMEKDITLSKEELYF